MTVEYIGSCVHLDGEFINELKDNDEAISYEEFIDEVPEETLVDMFPDYDWVDGSNLKLKDDYAASFHKVTLDDQEYFFVSWSSIEFVWKTVYR